MIFGIVIRLAKVFILALSVLAVVVFGVLYVPMLNEQRAALAELVFGRWLDREVEVAGDVDVSLRATTRIALSDVTLSNRPGSAKTDHARIDQVVFAFPLIPALRGFFKLAEVSISGMDFELSADGQTDRHESAGVAIQFIAWLLDKEKTPKLTLEDIVIARHNDPDGWNDTVVLTTVVANEQATDGGAITLKAAGTFNAAVFEITADFSALDTNTAQGANRTFSINARLPGTDVTLKGQLDPEAPMMDAQLEVVSKSLSQLLEAVRLKPETDGSGRLAVHLKGPIDEIAADGIKLTAALESGETATIKGAIAKPLDGQGIDLDIAVDLARGANDGARISTALDIDLRAIKGKLIGGLDGLEIRDLSLSTNIASTELKDIGPVTVARIVRDKHGRLSLLGLRLLEGDPAKPIFDLSGDVRDAIEFSEVSFKGSFNLNLVALLANEDPSGAGTRLAGKLSVSDATGRLELEELDAKTTGGAFALTLAKHGVEAPLQIDFTAKDIDAVAKEMGHQPIGGGEASFNGELRVVDDISLSGKTAIGESEVSVSLAVDVRDGQPILRGDLDASVLRLSDIQRTAALGGIFVHKPQRVEFEDEFSDGLDAELDLKATRLAGLEDDVSGLNTHLSYKQRQAVISPLKLDLFDGTLDARLTVDNKQKSPAVALSGTVDRIDVATILAQFEAQPLITGKLHARFDLGGQGETAKAMVQMLTGSLEVALVDAVLGNRLIDLTGQDIISWLFSGGASGQARLTCAVTGLGFEEGIGTFHPLVIATENVQLTGQGDLNLSDDTLKIAFQPHPVHKRLVNVVTPFTVKGPLTSPKVTGVSTADIAGRAALEAVTSPLRPLDLLFRHIGHEKKTTTNRHPCGDIPKLPSG